MKSSELHRLIQKKWMAGYPTNREPRYLRKNGKAYPVLYHGSKEVQKGIELKIKREMGLK